ncbi:hypothetical protein [Streptomyces sp. SD15]
MAQRVGCARSVLVLGIFDGIRVAEGAQALARACAPSACEGARAVGRDAVAQDLVRELTRR